MLATIDNLDNSKNFAESKFESHFAEFNKTLRLLGIRSEIKRKRIKLVEPRGAKVTIRRSITLRNKILEKPDPFKADELKSISRIHDKIQDHEHKDTVVNT